MASVVLEDAQERVLRHRAPVLTLDRAEDRRQLFARERIAIGANQRGAGRRRAGDDLIAGLRLDGEIDRSLARLGRLDDLDRSPAVQILGFDASARGRIVGIARSRARRARGAGRGSRFLRVGHRHERAEPIDLEAIDRRARARVLEGVAPRGVGPRRRAGDPPSSGESWDRGPEPLEDHACPFDGEPRLRVDDPPHRPEANPSIRFVGIGILGIGGRHGHAGGRRARPLAGVAHRIARRIAGRRPARRDADANDRASAAPRSCVRTTVAVTAAAASHPRPATPPTPTSTFRRRRGPWPTRSWRSRRGAPRAEPPATRREANFRDRAPPRPIPTIRIEP